MFVYHWCAALGFQNVDDDDSVTETSTFSEVTAAEDWDAETPKRKPNEVAHHRITFMSAERCLSKLVPMSLPDRVRTGHGNLEKSWNSEIKIPGLEKSWNLKYCLKSWKGHGISNKNLFFLKKFYFHV